MITIFVGSLCLMTMDRISGWAPTAEGARTPMSYVVDQCLLFRIMIMRTSRLARPGCCVLPLRTLPVIPHFSPWIVPHERMAALCVPYYYSYYYMLQPPFFFCCCVQFFVDFRGPTTQSMMFSYCPNIYVLILFSVSLICSIWNILFSYELLQILINKKNMYYNFM